MHIHFVCYEFIGLLLQIHKYTLGYYDKYTNTQNDILDGFFWLYGYYYKYTNTHWVTLHTCSSSTSEILKT